MFCADGAVSIDNNISEREMKRVVLNRKNSLFVGNPRGGRTAAILASLTGTCRRHDVDPQLYLTQLLMNLSRVRKSELPNWFPDIWRRLLPPRLASYPLSFTERSLSKADKDDKSPEFRTICNPSCAVMVRRQLFMPPPFVLLAQKALSEPQLKPRSPDTAVLRSGTCRKDR